MNKVENLFIFNISWENPLVLNISIDELVINLKEKLQNKTGIAVESQILMLSGKIMDNDRQIHQYLNNLTHGL